MSNMIEISPVEDTSKVFPVDILDRQELLDRLLKIFETLSSTKSSCSFALNGKWGAGKTFVIERLENQLIQDSEKYLVFHYNCWQYDYYDEPLIAIVSAMLDDIADHKYFLGSKGTKKKQIAKQVLINIISTFIESKIGSASKGLFLQGEENGENIFHSYVESVKNGVKKGLESEGSNYDKFRSFTKAIKEARKELEKLSNDYTLVIVVDELDRCLPEYAIKVLERLHHLFSGLQNTVLMLAIDKSQLNNTIKQIFGDETYTDAYLKKFIDFEVPLDTGRVNDSFFVKFSDYFALFDKDSSWPGIYRYLAVLFSEIDIRTQEQLIKRIRIIHQILFKDKERKCIFLCSELLIAFFSTILFDSNIAPLYYKHDDQGNVVLYIDKKIPTALANYIKSEWIYLVSSVIDANGKRRFRFDNEDYLAMPQCLIGYIEYVYGVEGGVFSSIDENTKTGRQMQDLKKFKEMLELIK